GHAEHGPHHARLRGRALRGDPDARRACRRVPVMTRPVGAPKGARADLAGAGLGVLMGVLFSFVVILGKGLLRGEPPFALLFFRFGVAAALLAVVCVATGRPLRPEPGERIGLAIAATLGYGTESALYFAGLNHGSAAAVTLLFYTYPVWVMLTAIALDRRLPAGMLAAALAFAIV